MPTFLPRAENFGRTGGVFGTRFAQEILPPRHQEVEEKISADKEYEFMFGLRLLVYEWLWVSGLCGRGGRGGHFVI